MSRFRLFGRSPDGERPGPPPYPSPAFPAPEGAGAAGPEAARRPPAADPPTDPFGFPPIPPPRSVQPPPAPAPAPVDPPSGIATPHPAEAAALAGAFAVDYLSWDEDDPDRRGRVLRDYLPTPGSDPSRMGWSGTGRQRAEFALPGLVRPDGEGRVLVDVRVRVTPYRSVGEHGPDPVGGPEPDVAGIPAVAPAPTGRGWRSMASYWIRISVPVASEGGRLVVDTWDETLGEDPPAPAPSRPDTEDHLLADDDPAGQSDDRHSVARPGGAW